MLIRFIISNFLSFDNECEFNMIAGSNRTHSHHLYKVKSLNILKGSAIYGPNGAGKSNFVKAIYFLTDLVNRGKLEYSINEKKYKLKAENLNKPIEIEIEFSFENKIYSYNISIDDKTIQYEALYLSGLGAEDKMVFERVGTKNKKVKINLATKYKKTQKDKLLLKLMEENLVEPNELFISKYELLKIEEITNSRNWLANNLKPIFPNSKFAMLIPAITSSNEFKNAINSYLAMFDIGVNELGIEDIDFDNFFNEKDIALKSHLLKEIEDGNNILLPLNNETVLLKRENNRNIVKRIYTFHSSKNSKPIKFDLSEESDGTVRLLDLIPILDDIINSNTTFVIDEIERSLHPNLIYDLIRKIMGIPETKGQLIFTTHESNLLDFNIFRQDEIWFAEKVISGATEFYSLSEFKPRYDLDIRKGYLKGRFGAIPYISNINYVDQRKENA